MVAPARRCVLCQERAANGNSVLCMPCRTDLRGRGLAWCSIGKHAVPADTLPGYRQPCAACVATRQVAPGTCLTCRKPLARHARCDGCTRLLHGEAARHPLCRWCARDRANGVPPLGYSWRELEGVR